jgi:hypothetical protein
MVVPPGIHGFKALADSTFVITIVGGAYGRHVTITGPSQATYVVRTPKALRDNGAMV